MLVRCVVEDVYISCAGQASITVEIGIVWKPSTTVEKVLLVTYRDSSHFLIDEPDVLHQIVLCTPEPTNFATRNDREPRSMTLHKHCTR